MKSFTYGSSKVAQSLYAISQEDIKYKRKIGRILQKNNLLYKSIKNWRAENREDARIKKMACYAFYKFIKEEASKNKFSEVVYSHILNAISITYKEHLRYIDGKINKIQH